MNNTIHDVYNDKTFDIKTIEDVKENSEVDLLSKNNDVLNFRLGYDFFKFNIKENTLEHFADYKSLFENINGKEVFNKNNIDNDFADEIVHYANDILNSNPKLPKDLEDKKEYLVKPKYKFSIKPSKYKQEIKEVSNKFTKSFDTNELKPVKDMFEIFVDLLSILTMLKLKKETSNQEVIDLVFKGLKDGSINYNELIKDTKLVSSIPELVPLLEDYKKNHIFDFKLNNTETVDAEIIESNNNILLLSNSSEKLKTVKYLSHGIIDKLLLSYDSSSFINKEMELRLENNDSKKFIKTHMEDNYIKYSKNYTPKEIIAAGTLIQAKISMSLDKNNCKKQIEKSLGYMNDNNIDYSKISTLFAAMEKNMFKAIILDKKTDIKQTSLKR